MSEITINYTSDYVNGTVELLKATDLGGLLKQRAKGGKLPRVSIKPTMVLAKPPSAGATTHAEVVEGIILYLRELGVNDIEIIESAWVGDDTARVYKVCGYDKPAEKYGVELFDLKRDKTRNVKVNGFAFAFDVCERAANAEFLINVPVLKAHCQTVMTCCLKNLKGCIPDKEKRRFHTLGLHKPIALLNKVIKADFNVIDGICGDLSFEEGGNPVTKNMLIAGADALTLDSYCAGLLGFHVYEVEYLGLAAKARVGELYNDETTVSELNADNKPPFSMQSAAGEVRRLARYIDEDGACSACYSALIHALKITGSKERVSIGQGFRGKTGRVGCGSCTSGFERFVNCCPPKAVDVVDFLAKTFSV